MSEDDESGDGRESRGGGFGPQDLIAVLRRRWRLVVAFAIIVGLLAAAVVIFMPNRYEAMATVQIDQRHKKIVDIPDVLSGVKADTATVDSEVEVVRSRQIALRVIETLNLRDDPEFAENSLLWRWLGKLGMRRTEAPVAETGARRLVGGESTMPILPPAKPGTTEPRRDEVLEAFGRNLRVMRIRTTLLIEIKYTASEPLKAAKIANTIAEVYIASQVQAKNQATSVATGLLEEKIRDLSQRVAAAERAVERFKAENNIFDAEGHLLSSGQLKREMEALLISQNETAQARSRYEQARRMMLTGEGNESIADVLKSHTVRLFADELTRASRKQAELATKYGPRHPEMLKSAADVAKAQSALTGEVNKIIRNLKTEYEVAVGREQQLSESLENLKVEIVGSRDKRWKLQELEREAVASRQVHESFLSRLKQTSETQGLQLPDAKVVELAGVPLFPVAPKRKQIVLIATAVGAVLGFALALVLELAGGGLMKPEDAERALDIPHIGSIPAFRRAADGLSDPMRSARLMISDPGGSLAETIRAIRHEIDARRRRNAPAVLLAASALPGEGKTTLASNLAHLYALSGRRTLLIDADLRRAQLTRLLGVEGQPGLLDVLVDRLPPEYAILHDATSGLHFMPASDGRSPDRPAAEILAGHYLPAALARLRHQFDTIVIDAAPLLPVVDGRIIASQADQIVVTMNWRTTPKKMVKAALKSLGPARARVIGVVVNKVEPALLGIDPDYGVERTGSTRTRYEKAA
jgi:exopolysaccharide transport family protein